MSDIRPADLVNKFQYALDNNWGYIGGKSGILWTDAAQNAAEAAFRNGDQEQETTAKFGRRWINHKVADCSGMFAWAFKQLGGYMYHGSNTMWSKYTTNKGTLVKGAREDGEALKPGTAVFKLRNNSDYYHVGLYVGQGQVIEARGTRYGVTTSNVSAWHTWAELKGVNYNDNSGFNTVAVDNDIHDNINVIEVQHTDRSVAVMNNTNAIVNVEGGVNLRSDKSTRSTRLATIARGTRIQAEVVDEEWSRVEHNGKTGYVMTRYISFDDTAANTNDVVEIINTLERELARLKALLRA